MPIKQFNTGNILHTDTLNPWEDSNGVYIVCATERTGTNSIPASIAYRIQKQFPDTHFAAIGKHQSQIHKIGGVFSAGVSFTESVRAHIFGVVCHEWWDMHTQDYSRAVEWMTEGLKFIAENGLSVNSVKINEALKKFRVESLSLLNRNDITLQQLAELNQKLLDEYERTRNPIVRIALMATWSPQACSELLKTMDASPLNLALYLPSVGVISAAVQAHPRLFSIPAVAALKELESA